MRITAFILAILVLVLSCLPCQDTDACILQDVCNEALVSNAHAPAKQDVRHQDCCSPFCQCACCAAIGLPQLFQVRVVAWTKPVTHRYNAYLPPSLREISLPVWQPPQLAA